ncbi:hepcidin-like [Synchiropus splendidus]|uniref:hepcidin-like n=1 Tax=Synchiropus splendidus TaxID=270530 RepID=UPI00237E52D8|nr:hepcidin-like [Synchiropus splendidus]
MKTFSVAVLVAVVVVVACVEQSSVAPPSEVRSLQKIWSVFVLNYDSFLKVEDQDEMVLLQDEVMDESRTAGQEQMVKTMWEVPQSRQRRRFRCRFCCRPRFCGICCRW